MVVGAAIREDLDGGGKGVACSRLAERAWEENSSKQRPVAFALSLSLTDRRPRSIDDLSTIDRRTDPFDLSRSQSFDDQSRSMMIVQS